MNTVEENLDMVKDCINRDTLMTDWECDFIDSIYKQLSNGNSLSQKQETSLEAIWDKVTKNG